MDKSNLLDELRLEIGLVRDQVETLSSFYIGITRKFANLMQDRWSSVAIYETTSNAFIMKVCAGPCYLERLIPFGESILSTVAIRGELLFQEEANLQKVFLPFYKDHHLLGIITGHIPKESYEITEEDFSFVKEVGRFIEVQHEIFYPSNYRG
ncbi:hypothetical protein [Halalkalibacter akibai]|uniref:GAF domain-containing protein n=1 Tax=Halalkalibacter akibai (strain ATCC 43226 / DSM 21942 / CIP 109018 / JCM 9157 / 1139) TaxID=1236973 RepID=W4QNY5_HALA3|nr:hypothetical protein [Halalkalibacter akibai]GAE33791.1 hypothetical protein JCM9157_816 [Halalkalibacter akibai JCM 9157]